MLKSIDWEDVLILTYTGWSFSGVDVKVNEPASSVSYGTIDSLNANLPYVVIRGGAHIAIGESQPRRTPFAIQSLSGAYPVPLFIANAGGL